MLKFTFDKKTGKTLVQRKTNQTKKTTTGKTYVVFDVLGFIERSPIDLTAQQKRYSIAEDVTQQQQYILTHVCSDLANVFSTKELSQYYKATLREWLKSNREMVNMGLDHAFVNTEPHQMDIDEVLAER